MLQHLLLLSFPSSHIIFDEIIWRSILFNNINLVNKKCTLRNLTDKETTFKTQEVVVYMYIIIEIVKFTFVTIWSASSYQPLPSTQFARGNLFSDLFWYSKRHSFMNSFGSFHWWFLSGKVIFIHDFPYSCPGSVFLAFHFGCCRQQLTSSVTDDSECYCRYYQCYHS